MFSAYPVWQIDFSLLSNKLQYTSMCHRLLGPVYQLEEHRVCDVQSSELVEGGRWHDDLAAMVHVLTLGSGQHSDGVAAVVFIEAAGRSSCAWWAAHHA